MPFQVRDDRLNPAKRAHDGARVEEVPHQSRGLDLLWWTGQALPARKQLARKMLRERRVRGAVEGRATCWPSRREASRFAEPPGRAPVAAAIVAAWARSSDLFDGSASFVTMRGCATMTSPPKGAATEAGSRPKER